MGEDIPSFTPEETGLLHTETEQQEQLPLPYSSNTRARSEPLNRKPKPKSLCTCCKPRKRPRNRSETGPKTTLSIRRWIAHLPLPEHLESMSRPPSKRSRSSDSLVQSQFGDGTESTITRDAKFSAYKDSNYTVVLETKRSFMYTSETGVADDDRNLCRTLLHAHQPDPKHSMFDDSVFDRFCSLMRGRSEARLFLDLHPLLVPSAENLFISGQSTLKDLTQGYNDPWVKAIPFYGPRPQPDHTVGFKWSTFTDEQRRKLGIEPHDKSYYTAREDIFFPFLTSEIKCGKEALDLADRQNAHSMTLAVRGIVELYRKAEREVEVHRKIVAFSISHDDKHVRIYGHYPEIDGQTTAYYRHTIEDFPYSRENGKYRWTSYRFTRNIYDIFVPAHLERIKGVLDQLPDPAIRAPSLAVNVDEEAFPIPQERTSSAPNPQESDRFKKPESRKDGGVDAELRIMLQSLQQELERQREEAKQREEKLMELLKQQSDHLR